MGARHQAGGPGRRQQGTARRRRPGRRRIAARIIDLYSVKPVDSATLAEAAAATGGRLVIAEDHYPQGGLGAAVLEAHCGTDLPLRARQCAVSGLPGSGAPDELMDAAGISASRIAAACELLKD